MGHEPRDKDAGEGAGIEGFLRAALCGAACFAASGRRGFVAPRWHENQAAAAAMVSQAFKASAVYISAGPPPM